MTSKVRGFDGRFIKVPRITEWKVRYTCNALDEQFLNSPDPLNREPEIVVQSSAPSAKFFDYK